MLALAFRPQNASGKAIELAFSIRDEETDRKAAEIAAAMGESKAAAVRKAVDERSERLRLEGFLPRPAEAWLVRLVDPETRRF